MMPPLITVGSRLPASSRVATREVVVVLPWVPAMATQDLKRISSASISARRTTGRRRSRAATSSGLSRRIAVETTTRAGLLDVAGLVADEGAHALLGQAPDVGVVVGVRPLHGVAEVVHHLGDAGHADAADADEVDGTELVGQLHGKDQSQGRRTRTIGADGIYRRKGQGRAAVAMTMSASRSAAS